jgi:type II secretory pathway pseudopilin PulG
MKRKYGFSLIEVNLAIFVVSVGLLTLFTLFPAGLKEGEAGHADTQTSLFGDYIMSTIRANSLKIPTESWDSAQNDLLDDLPGIGYGGSTPASIEFPKGSGLYVRYYLEVVRMSGQCYGIRLWVASGAYGTKKVATFKKSAFMYYTEVFFSGMP